MPYDSTTWIQGQTSLNPAGQDYMRLRDQGYARNLAQYQQEFQLEQTRKMAEIGAQRLEALGGEGAQWAEQLRRDPYAAFALAKEYGGFQAIEQKLQYGQAAGKAASAGAMGIDDQMLSEIAKIYGPEKAAEIYDKLASAEKNLRPQVVGDRKGGQIAQVIGNQFVPLKGAPAPDVDGGDPNVKFGNILTLRGQLDKGAAGFRVQQQYYRVAMTAAEDAARAATSGGDPISKGRADFALINAYAKMLDPTSRVTEQEGDIIVEQGSSAVQAMIKSLRGQFSAQGILTDTARLDLMRQIEAVYRGAEAQYAKYNEQAQQIANDPAIDPAYRGFILPIGVDPIPESFDYTPWEKLAGRAAPGSANDKPTPLPSDRTKWVRGKLYSLKKKDGTTATGRWNPDTQGFD